MYIPTLPYITDHKSKNHPTKCFHLNNIVY